MNGVDDAGSAPRAASVNCLRKLKIGIHQRCRIDEPCAQMLSSFAGIARIAGQDASRGERRHLHTEPDECVSVPGEVLRVRHAVALDVGAIRVFRIWPPVVSFGKIIVFAASAPRT